KRVRLAGETAKRGQPCMARTDGARSALAPRLIVFLLALSFAACRQAAEEPQFPPANRDVAPIVADAFSTEDARDRLGEAEQVIAFAGVKPGMSVADIGAGQGYYTVRLSPV